MSQTAAGEAVKKSRGTIVNWENPKNSAEPDSDEVATLARLYHVTSKDLRFSDLRRPTGAVVVGPPAGVIVQGHNSKEEAESDAIEAEKDRAAAEERRRKKRKAGGET